ncbi:unnamed protein product [Symbiodinium necroappetens]|uniref:Uncharacterized protein n=1 Tax=Symbiodinium necroappetens TaxID=1628268 RepID=A0A812ZHX7_9DINO|nr:unnamed protein product [Symbiodinium necroappetens]
MDQSIVLNLMQLGAPKVLLLRWVTSLTFQPRFQLFDLFCGEGNMGKTWWPIFKCNFWMMLHGAPIYTVEFAKNMLSAYKEWIPDSWLEAMRQFHDEVRRNVSWVHPI